MFIDEEGLLKAMAARDHRLTPEERKLIAWDLGAKFSFNPCESTLYCLGSSPLSIGAHTKWVHSISGHLTSRTQTLAGTLSLKTLPLVVNAHGSKSRYKLMVVHIRKSVKGEEVAARVVGERMFMGWPFLREWMSLIRCSSTRRWPSYVGHWPRSSRTHALRRAQAGRSYRAGCGVITGHVDFLLHVLPSKALESGAFVKDHEGPEKETEHAVQIQMCLPGVVLEDPLPLENARHLRGHEGAKIFLGEHAYGVAAHVPNTTETSLFVILKFFPAEKTERHVQSGGSEPTIQRPFPVLLGCGDGWHFGAGSGREHDPETNIGLGLNERKL